MNAKKLRQVITIPKLLVALLVLSVFSCSDSSILNEYKDFEAGYWAYTEPVTFEFTIADTSVNYNIDYYVRNSMDYEFYNLYIAYSLENAEKDTLRSSMHESNLVDPTTGKPLGGTAGDFYDHTVPLFNNFHFSDTGRYQFSINQYMRRDTLEHIHAVGLKVAPVQKGS